MICAYLLSLTYLLNGVSNEVLFSKLFNHELLAKQIGQLIYNDDDHLIGFLNNDVNYRSKEITFEILNIFSYHKSVMLGRIGAQQPNFDFLLYFTERLDSVSLIKIRLNDIEFLL